MSCHIRDEHALKTGEKKIDESGPIEDPNIHNGHVIHYISWIFGIVLSCLYISTITIIPLHNTLREPEYFWEFMLYMSFGFCSIFAAHIVLATFFVANVNPGNNLLAFLVMTLVGAIINIVTTVFYYIIWVYVLGFFAPMPMALYIPGSITVIGCIGLSWFTYQTFIIHCKKPRYFRFQNGQDTFIR